MKKITNNKWRDTSLNKPMGVSQWETHGKKYKYDEYFNKILLKKINKWLLENHEHLDVLRESKKNGDNCYVNSLELEKFIKSIVKSYEK